MEMVIWEHDQDKILLNQILQQKYCFNSKA